MILRSQLLTETTTTLYQHPWSLAPKGQQHKFRPPWQLLQCNIWLVWPRCSRPRQVPGTISPSHTTTNWHRLASHLYGSHCHCVVSSTDSRWLDDRHFKSMLYVDSLNHRGVLAMYDWPLGSSRQGCSWSHWNQTKFETESKTSGNFPKYAC